LARFPLFKGGQVFFSPRRAPASHKLFSLRSQPFSFSPLDRSPSFPFSRLQDMKKDRERWAGSRSPFLMALGRFRTTSSPRRTAMDAPTRDVSASPPFRSINAEKLPPPLLWLQDAKLGTRVSDRGRRVLHHGRHAALPFLFFTESYSFFFEATRPRRALVRHCPELFFSGKGDSDDRLHAPPR